MGIKLKKIMRNLPPINVQCKYRVKKWTGKPDVKGFI